MEWTEEENTKFKITDESVDKLIGNYFENE